MIGIGESFCFGYGDPFPRGFNGNHLQVIIDHDLDEFIKGGSGFPLQFRSGFGDVRFESFNFCRLVVEEDPNGFLA